jgi:hypothetical protein
MLRGDAGREVEARQEGRLASSVAAQCTIAVASWLLAIASRTPPATSAQPPRPRGGTASNRSARSRATSGRRSPDVDRQAAPASAAGADAASASRIRTPARARRGRRRPGSSRRGRGARCPRARGHRRLGDPLLAERAAPGDRLDDVAVAVAGREVHRRVDAGGIAASRCSTTLIASTKARQSVAPSRRRLPMLLLDRHLVGGLALARQLEHVLDERPRSARRCSSQVMGTPAPGPGPAAGSPARPRTRCCSGGPASTISARTRTTSPGALAATSIIRSTQVSAARGRDGRGSRASTTRRRFSSSARRSMIGIAHSSPRRSAAPPDRRRRRPAGRSTSRRPCECEMSSRMRS